MPRMTNTYRHDAITNWLANGFKDKDVTAQRLGWKPDWDADLLASLIDRRQGDHLLKQEAYHRELARLERLGGTYEWAQERKSALVPVMPLPPLGPPPAKPRPTILRANREVPIHHERWHDRIEGYIDYLVQFTTPTLRIDRDEWCVEEYDHNNTWAHRFLCFEIKPEIPSVSEVIRQINRYRHHFDKGRRVAWIVVGPSDDETESILSDEGIHFLAAPAHVASSPQRGLDLR